MRYILTLTCFIPLSVYARLATLQDIPYSLKRSHYDIKVNKDGTSSGHHSLTFEVLKESAREKFSLYKLPFDSHSSEIKVTLARVINGGNVQIVSPDKIVEGYKTKDAGFDDVKELQIAFPQVQVKSLVNIEYDFQTKAVPVANHYSLTSFIGSEGFVEQNSLHIESEIPLYHYLNDPKKMLAVHQSTKNNRHHLKIDLVRPLTSGVVEENSVLGKDMTTFFHVTSDKDWTLIGSAMKNHFERALTAELPKELEGVVLEAKKLHSLQEKVDYLVSYITGEYNYVGDWRTVKGEFAPREMKVIVSTKSGDCKDFATILTVMLRKLSIAAEPSLVHRSSPAETRFLNPKAPSLSLFNHAIVRVKADGKTYWIDPTNKTSFALKHRIDIAGKYALPLDGKHQLEIIPIVHQGTSMRVVKVINFEDEKKGTVAVNLSMDGELALAFTGMERSQSKEKINQIFLGMVSQGEKPVVPEVRDYDLRSNTFKKIEIGMKYSAHDIGKLVEGEYRIPLFDIKRFLGPLSYDLSSWKGDILLGAPQRIQKSLIMKRAFVKTRPADCIVKSPWFEVNRNFKLLKDGVRVTDDIHIKTPLIPNSAFKTTDMNVLQASLQTCIEKSYLSFSSQGSHETPSAQIDQLYKNLNMQERIQKRLELAEAIHREEDTGGYTKYDAIDLLRMNIAEEPKDAPSYALLAQLHFRLGYYNVGHYGSAYMKEAYAILEKGLKHNPGHPSILICKAHMKRVEGKNEESQGILASLETSTFSRPDDYLRAARTYMKLTDGEKTVPVLEGAAQDDKINGGRMPASVSGR